MRKSSRKGKCVCVLGGICTIPALRLPPVGLLAEEKPKEEPPVPTPPNPGPPPKPAEKG